MAKKKKQNLDPATVAFNDGLQLAMSQPTCQAILTRARLVRGPQSKCPRNGWAIVYQSGRIDFHPSRRAEPREWEYVAAHCALHLGFGHLEADLEWSLNWQAACDVVVDKFLHDLRVGHCPYPFAATASGNEMSLYRQFSEAGLPNEMKGWGTGAGEQDMIFDTSSRDRYGTRLDFKKVFALGLTNALPDAVEVAAGYGQTAKRPLSLAQRAQKWFLANFPLLGAMTSAFTIVEDV